jgi:trehalose-phosphatase
MRARGRDKGDAVREVLAGRPEGAACAYLGDDLTDEDAFAALDGRGLGVLVSHVPRGTRAHAWVRPPVGVLTFLHRWRNAIA